MTKVLVAGLKQETNTFVPGVTTLAAFRRMHLVEGDEFYGPQRGTGQEIDGFLKGAREAGFEVIPAVDALATAGPRVADDAYRHMRDRIFSLVSDHRQGLSGVLVALHGAMVTETLADAEGDLLSGIRALVGPDVPVVATFDMHCAFTPAIAAAVDGVVGYQTFPHIDFEETGVRGFRLLARTIRREVKARTAFRKIRMFTEGRAHVTTGGPMREIMQLVRQIESRPGVLAASIFTTCTWTDVPDLGWTSVVVTNGDSVLAQALADEIAAAAWERRNQFVLDEVSVSEAVALATRAVERPFVLADLADITTGGAFGDGNVLLRELITTGFDDSALLTITDPAAVARCFNAGVGADVTVDLGGRCVPEFFQSISVAGRVSRLSEGRYFLEHPVMPIDIGRTALLQVGRINIVVSEYPAWTIDQSVYHYVGLEPRDAKIVQVKSNVGFRALYGAAAAGVIEFSSKGPTDTQLARLPYRNVRRPIWPLDRELQQAW